MRRVFAAVWARVRPWRPAPADDLMVTVTPRNVDRLLPQYSDGDLVGMLDTDMRGQ